MSTLNIKTAALIGISLGGWISLKFSAQYPERVTKLVVLCPSGVGPQKISLMFKVIPLMFFGRWGIDKAIALVNGDQAMPEEAVQYTKLISNNFYTRVVVVPLLTDPELQQLTMPVFLIVGAKDVMLHSHKTAIRMKKILPHAKITMLPEAGHVLINQAERIMAFLRTKE